MVKNSRNSICPDERSPHFFKIVHPDLTTQCLRIPPEFMKHISKEVSERAILEGPSGNHWHVKLCKTTDGTYLQDGWQDFLRDHSLWDYEFLVFRYDGNMHFNVQIFDKSGCEREDVFTIKTHQGYAFSNGGNKRGRPPKKIVGSACKKGGRPPKKFVGSGHLSQSKACEKDPGIETVTQERIKTEDVGLPIHERSSQDRGSLSRRRSATEGEKARVWKAANSFTSNLPYFMRCLGACNVYKSFVLAIPVRFAREHLPRWKAKVVLRNPKGKAWIVNSVPGNGRTYTFCGGWTDFVRGNKLEEGDICVFELVGESEMCVHIFRLIKEIKFEC